MTKRIAINRPGAIGDIIMILNLVPSLKEKHPDYQIDFYCAEHIGNGLRYIMEYAGINKIFPHTVLAENKKRYLKVFNLIGYPFHENYPMTPMRQHLIQYFAEELGLDSDKMYRLTLPLPPKPENAPISYATIQNKTGWSNYKEWFPERWEELVKMCDFPVIQIGEKDAYKIPGAIHDYMGQDLTTAISLIANSNLHIGLDSFGNHLTNYQWQSQKELRDIPAIILWGSSQATAAGYSRNINISSGLNCQPCFKQNPELVKDITGEPCNNPPEQNYHSPRHECMMQISVEQVFAEIQKKWQPGVNIKNSSKPTVCLTMIVKNESHIIHEVLTSVYKHINYWVVVDTGSTDNTKEIIQTFFADHNIPGELHTRAWKNFGDNRTESLRLADGKCDYMWVIDADDKLNGNIDFTNLTKDGYYLKYKNHAITFLRMQLFKSGKAWKYVGVLHEYPDTALPFTADNLAGDYVIEARTLGARNNDPQKYAKDAAMIRQALIDDPGNSRYWFYLGRSCVSAGNLHEAKKAFQRRIELGGWKEELFCAWLELGHCEIKLNSPEADIVQAFLSAYNVSPRRAESLYSLANYYRLKGKIELGYIFAKMAADIPLPDYNALFVSPSVYHYQALDELSVCAYYSEVAKYVQDGYEICKQLVAKDGIPEPDKGRILANLESYELYKVHK